MKRIVFVLVTLIFLCAAAANAQDTPDEGVGGNPAPRRSLGRMSCSWGEGANVFKITCVQLSPMRKSVRWLFSPLARQKPAKHSGS